MHIVTRGDVLMMESVIDKIKQCEECNLYTSTCYQLLHGLPSSALKIPAESIA